MGELATRIRAKYPGAYDSIDDATLESKVVAKYPGVYDHLVTPSNNPADYPQGKSVSEAERMRREFIRQEKDNASIRERLPDAVQEVIPTREQVGRFVRPMLEGGGAVAGGILGAGGGGLAGLAGGPAAPGTVPYGAIAGGVAGSALGYAGGASLADLIQGTNPSSAGEATTRTLRNLGTGATYEMGGQVAAKGISSAISAARRAKIPLTEAWNNAKAGRILSENIPDTPTTIATRSESEALLNRLGTDITPTPAQMTNSRSMAGLEQAAMAQNRGLTDIVTTRNAQLNNAGLANIQNQFGPAAAPLQPETITGIGGATRDAVTAARSPLKESEKAAWQSVPEYPMPTQNTMAAINELKSTPLPKTVQSAVDNVVEYINSLPKTTNGMRAAEQTINGEITKAARAGDNNIQSRLYSLKEAIRADFDELGTAAAKGDIAVNSTGSIVYPTKLAADLAKVETRLSEAAATQKPDMEAVRSALQQAGAPYHTFNKVDRMDNGLEQRMIDTYKRMISPELPTAGNTKLIESLAAEKIALEQQLASLQPAEDAASAIKNARNISIEVNKRYKTGATKELLKRGDDLSGYKMKAEDIPRQYFTPTGTNDLIRAVGKSEARNLTTKYAEAELAKLTDNNGALNLPKAYQWLRRNTQQLETTGSRQDVLQMLKEQTPAAIRAAIESKGKVDILGNPSLTAREALKLYKEYAPIIKAAYGKDSAAQLGALRDYQQLVSMLGRNQGVTGAGNSTTVEKGIDVLFSNAPPSSLAGRIFSEVSGAIIGGAAGTVVGGPHGGAYGAVAGTALTAAGKAAIAHAKDATRQLLAEAITNPETAKMLMDIRRGVKISPAKINSHLITLGIIGAADSGREQ